MKDGADLWGLSISWFLPLDQTLDQMQTFAVVELCSPGAVGAVRLCLAVGSLLDQRCLCNGKPVSW